MKAWWRSGQHGAPDAVAQAFHTAGATGLGLTGPGAVSAARVLVLHALCESGLGPNGQVVIAQSDLDLLLGSPYSRVSSAAVVVTPTRVAALDYAAAHEGRPLLVVCTAEPGLAQRARALTGSDGTTRVVFLGIGGGRQVDVGADGRMTTCRGRPLFAAAHDELHALRTTCGYVPMPTDQKALVLRVLGQVRLELWNDGVSRDITQVLTAKQRELLVFLAVARGDGARRERLNQAVWPGSPPKRPYNSLHNALSRLRGALSDASSGAVRDIVLRSQAYYRINQDVVDVDYWRFRDPTSDPLTLYRGDLGEGIDAAWIDLPREASRHLVSAAVKMVAISHNGDRLVVALSLLHKLRSGDPYNETIYRDIMRIQLKLGRTEDARQTFELLQKVLGKIDQESIGSIRSIWNSV